MRIFPEECGAQEIFSILLWISKERSAEEKLFSRNVNIDEMAGINCFLDHLRLLFLFRNLYSVKQYGKFIINSW